MISRAKADTFDPAIEYRTADLETLEPPEAAFDLVYSALIFQGFIGQRPQLAGGAPAAIALISSNLTMRPRAPQLPSLISRRWVQRMR